MFGVSTGENDIPFSYILFNGNIDVNLYKHVPTYIHELLHATKFHLIYLTSINDEETECYFMGHLVDRYCNLLKEYENNNSE